MEGVRIMFLLSRNVNTPVGRAQREKPRTPTGNSLLFFELRTRNIEGRYVPNFESL